MSANADSLDSLGWFRSKRELLFALVPFGGAALGAVCAELVPGVHTRSRAGVILMIGEVALWSAIFSSFLTVTLFWADQLYRRGRLLTKEVVLPALIAGTLAGGLAGAVAQAVYSLDVGSLFFKDVVLRTFCWGIMGALLGWRLASRVPNLGALRGSVGGGIGGMVGGIAFILLCSVLPELLGRLLGVGLLGAALGLTIVTVEQIFRTASMTVVWAPKETTTVTLGTTPVSIGGGDDHVVIRGLPRRAVVIGMEQGKIFCTELTSGKKTQLKDKSTIDVGKVQIVITAKA